jgi:lysophospholipase L1-like esterase
VCGFTGPATLPPPAADGTIAVPAQHPLVSYAGRMDCHAPAGPLLGFVGSSVRVRFVGTQLDLRLKDFGGGTPQNTNYYDVSIDGQAPTLLEVSPEQELYTLGSGLAEGEHQVELFKRGESTPGGSVGAGRGQILGFVLHGTELLPVPAPRHRLEFIGDSITCGYGNELSTMDPSSAHFTSKASNGHKAYGALTAARLGAAYLAVAYSGRGISRNFAGFPAPLLPELYLQSVPEDPQASAWNPAQYRPDAVIINLGSNDFSTPGVKRDAFLRAYVDFLARLRGYYPEALLVVVIGPMLSDAYPPGENALSNATADIKAAIAEREQAGDKQLRLVVFPQQTGPWGEDWHPTLATHEKMAEQLSRELKVMLGW